MDIGLNDCGVEANLTALFNSVVLSVLQEDSIDVLQSRSGQPLEVLLEALGVEMISEREAAEITVCR